MTHLALLRGINVGGKNALPMKELAQIFSDAGCTNVRTFIQSGNVIFEAPGGAPKLAEVVTAKIEKRFGYRIPVIIRTSEQLLKTIRGNPFLKTGADEKMLHVISWPLRRALARLRVWIPPGRRPTLFTRAAKRSICNFPTAWRAPN